MHMLASGRRHDHRPHMPRSTQTTEAKAKFFIFRHWGISQCRKIKTSHFSSGTVRRREVHWTDSGWHRGETDNALARGPGCSTGARTVQRRTGVGTDRGMDRRTHRPDVAGPGRTGRTDRTGPFRTDGRTDRLDGQDGWTDDRGRTDARTHARTGRTDAGRTDGTDGRTGGRTDGRLRTPGSGRRPVRSGGGLL